MEMLEKVVEICLEKGASDIHIGNSFPPTIRVNGELIFLNEFPPLIEQEMNGIIHVLLSEQQFEQLEQGIEVDFAFTFRDKARFRVNVYKERRGINLAMRYIPEKINTLEDLRLPQTIQKMLKQPYGLILITGPTGSGKSTTVAAMVEHINSTRKAHIITIEDPIEYVHENKESLIKQRLVGPEGDSQTFPNALRAALREDPDVIVVGEMRDKETTALAITAAETGHLVISTLHTNTAYQAIHRIIDIFPSDQQSQIRLQLAQNIVGIISQRLIPKIQGGRIAAIEIMVGTNAIRTQIRENKIQSIPNTIKTSREEGMVLLQDYIADLQSQGVITDQEASRFLFDQG